MADFARTIQATASYTAVAPGLLFDGTMVASGDNTSEVYRQGDDGSDVVIPRAVPFLLKMADLGKIRIKGTEHTSADVVTFIGEVTPSDPAASRLANTQQ